MRFLMASDPWGYGSTTVLLAISAHLPKDIEQVYLGTGVSLQLAATHDFTATYDVGPRDLFDIELAQQLISSSDVVVASMDLEVTRLAIRLGKPCIHIDGLAWMWESPLGWKQRIDAEQLPMGLTRYIVERFPGVQEKLKSWDHHFPNRDLVAPIIDDRFLATRRDAEYLLWNVGGLSSWVMPEDVQFAYGVLVYNIAHEVHERVGFRIELCGGAHVMEYLRGTGTDRNIWISSLPHAAFLERLAGARAFISTAGMRGIFEGFAYGVPTAFLPPQNMSQALALVVLRQEGVARFGLEWSEFYAGEEFSGWKERDVLETINRHILAAADDHDFVEAAARLFCNFLGSAKATAEVQRTWYSELGEGGAADAARILLEVAGARPPEPGSD